MDEPLMDIDRTPGRRIDVRDERVLAELAPTIWPFRATWIEFVGPEGLPEWEEALRSRVGLSDPNERYATRPGCATISGVNGHWGDCDTVC